MGAKNTSYLKSENITEAVTKIITNTLQSVSQAASNTQQVSINCTEIQTVASDNYKICTNENKDRSIDDILKLCKPYLDLAKCNIADINQSGSMIINFQSISNQETVNKIDSNLSNNLENTIKQNTGAPFSSNKSKQDITNIVEVVSKILSENNQEVISNIDNVQTVSLQSGGTISVVSQTSVQDYFSKILQNNTSYNNLVSDVVNENKNLVDQSSDMSINNIRNIILLVLGILFIIFIFILSIRYIFRRKNENPTIDINVNQQ